MAEIGSFYHFSDESGTRDIYLQLYFIHPNGFLYLTSDDNYYEFHLRPLAKGLVQIDEQVYKTRSFK